MVREKEEIPFTELGCTKPDILIVRVCGFRAEGLSPEMVRMDPLLVREGDELTLVPMSCTCSWAERVS